MLVGERMSHPIISVAPDMAALDALDMMRRERIRRAPVIHDGKLVGIVSERTCSMPRPPQRPCSACGRSTTWSARSK